MTRYLLGVDFQSGPDDSTFEEWTPEEVTAHLDYYAALHKELVENGELVDSTVLTGPDLAKIVRSDGVTAPVVTDGPFQEFKEWLAGFQIVDVGVGAARDRDRRPRLGRAGTRRRTDAAADRGAKGDGRGARGRRRDGVVTSTR